MPSWSKRSTDQATKPKAKDQATKAKDQATLNLPERSYALPPTLRLKKKHLRKCPPQAQQASIMSCPKELEEEEVSTPPPGAPWQLEEDPDHWTRTSPLLLSA